MIAIDTNVLVYAIDPNAHLHSRAAEVVSGLAGPRDWGLPASVVFEFLATTTSPAFPAGRRNSSLALEAVDRWLAAPGCRILPDPLDVWERARALIESSGVRGRDVHDARIAATCIAHGVSEFWTADGDFLRFPELRIRNPLVG